MKRALTVVLAIFCWTAVAAAQQPMRYKADALKVTPALIRAELISVDQAGDDARADAAAKGARGPTLPALSLGDLVPVAQLDKFGGVRTQDLCRYSLQVYADANRDSGIYYYRPKKFVLRFDPDDGYYLSVDYKAGAAGADNVLIQARLTPGAGPTDRAVLESLLEAYLHGSGGPEPVLMPLPASYEAAFNLSDWNVDEVTINGVDPDSGEIVLTLSADVPTKELVTSTLGNVNGLVGSVRLTPLVISNAQTMTQAVDLQAELRLADLEGGPPLHWRSPTGSHAEFVNAWPFDLRLHYLAYLIEESPGRVKLRGWRLGDTLLEPGDTARTAAADLNTEIEGNQVVTALYVGSLVRDDDAVRRVVDELTGGVGALPVQELTIDVIRAADLFDQYGVYKLAVEVRSAHFDPEGRQVESRTYQVDESSETVQADSLYLWEDSGDTYQYRVGVVTIDGTVHSDSVWRRPNPVLPYTITVGSKLIEEVLAE
jgi:hypothetical protein